MNLVILILPSIFLLVIAFFFSKNIKRILILYFVFLVIYTFLNNENAPILTLFGFGVTLWDIWGFILFIMIVQRGLLRTFENFIRVPFSKLFIVYFLGEVLIMIFSIANYGVTTISTYKLSFYFFPFLLLLLTFKYDQETDNIIYNFLKALVIFSIIIYLLRVVGVISLYSHYAEAAELGSWNEIRYLSNNETLYLLLFLIISIKDRKQYLVTNTNRILSFISFVLIITSTQRTVTLLLILFVIYELLTETAYTFKKYSVYFLLTVVVFYFLSSNFTYYLDASVNNVIYNFAASNGGYRVLDAQVTINTMLNRHNFLFGEMITPEIFSRYLGFGVMVNYPVHNLFILSFVHGGLFLVIPMLLFWLLPLGKLLFLRIRKKINLTQEIAFLWLLVFFIFNNTSGVGIFNGLVFAYVLWSLDKKNSTINES